MKNIFIPNQESYDSIVDNIRLEWSESVYVLADFDKTLTKAFVKWKAFPSLIALLRKDPNILWEEYAQKAHDLYNHYNKIEEDPALSTQEKIPFMTEWWQKHQDLLVKSGLTKQHIEDAINSGYLYFRDGIETFLSILEQKNIPLVIMSANGIGWDSIRMFFEKCNLMSPNIHIISNELLFDEQWVTCGFSKKVIHSFNKSETSIIDYPEIHENIKDRRNVILMWDSLGDPYMTDWSQLNNILKLWFFNTQSLSEVDRSSELFWKYKKLYNGLLLWNSDLDFVNELLQDI